VGGLGAPVDRVGCRIVDDAVAIEEGGLHAARVL
jgi:hypothetical protein